MKRKSLPENQRVFTFTSASELLASKQPVAVAVPVKAPVPSQIASSTPAVTISPVSAPEVVDFCEYARDPISIGSSGRYCVDGTFCPIRIFGNVEFYRACVTRAMKLKAQREQLQ